MTRKKNSIFALTIAATTIGILSSTIFLSYSASAQQETIPEWIQNIALFWGQGDISEEEFVKALEFLGDEGILRLPSTESAEAQEITRSLEDLQKRVERIEDIQTRPPDSDEPQTRPTEEPTDTRYPNVFAICPSDKIRHFDKVTYRMDPSITGPNNSPIPHWLICPNQASLHNGELAIMILEENHDEINKQIRIEARLVQQLKDNDCHMTNLSTKQDVPITHQSIEILDVDYGVICANKPGFSGPIDSFGSK